jgi:release factor glutamine methyltransferase
LDKVGLYSSLGEPVNSGEASLYASLVLRRESHEPTAYIAGHKEFFGLDFEVDRSVLIPRPESELLVEGAIELASTAFPDSCLVADVGTGCGAIAVAIAVNVRQARMYATDVAQDALEVAGANCERHGVADRVTLLHGDLLGPLPEPVHLIVANLPYVRESEMAELSPEVTEFEPTIALCGGSDGLREIERLLLQVRANLLTGGAVLLEIGCDQGQGAREMARRLLPDAEVSVASDISGLERVVSIRMPKPGGPRAVGGP